MSKSTTLLVSLAWRNMWRNTRRTLITLLTVSVGVLSVLMFAALLDAWNASSRERTLSLLIGSGKIHAEGYRDDPTVDHKFDAPSGFLRSTLDSAGIRAWAPRIAVPAVIQSEYKTLPLDLYGVEPDAERAVSKLPRSVVQGGYLTSSDGDGLYLGEDLLRRLQTHVGRRVIVLAQDRDGNLAERSFEIVGTYGGAPDIEKQTAFIGLLASQRLLGVEGSLSEVVFRVENDEMLDEQIAHLRRAAPELDIQDWRTLSSIASAIDSTSKAITDMWLWVMFVLMAFGIINTQLMAVFERKREFGLLQALGMKSRSILGLVTLESLLLIGFGCLLGFGASLILITALADGIDLSGLARGAALIGASDRLYPAANLPAFTMLTLVIWSLGVLVSLWPAFKASQSEPVEVMSHAS